MWKSGGGGGDPHFKPWNGHRFSYHGECDLVLLRSDEFADGLGLDLHVRTTIHGFYSLIEAAALRIGPSVLEVSGGLFWVNGTQGSDEQLPLSMSGFTLHPPYTQDANTRGTGKVYKLDLNGGDKILFRNYKHLLTVDVSGSSQDFGNSVGLMGHYETGALLARDGETEIPEANVFGHEWQVQDHEPMLFVSSRAPQHPHDGCNMPEQTVESRHLRESKNSDLIAAAEEACAGKHLDDFEFCVFDVLATEDIGLAGVW